MSGFRTLRAAVVLALLLAAVPMPARAQLASEGPLRMYVLDCGKLFGLSLASFSPGRGKPGDTIDLVGRCYLIRHPSGMLLWDTGLPDIAARWYARAFLWITNLGRSPVRVDRTLAEQLAELGVAPEQIRYLAFSHLHTDHAGNANAFAKSTWLVQRPEYEAAFSPAGEKARFDPDYYDQLRDAKRMILDGDHDVFGDGSVVILSAPGHTPGHQCLFINLPKSGPIVLSGDLYHTQQNRRERLMPDFNTDREQTLRSMDRIEAFIQEHNARLLIQHDIESNRDVPLSPAYLD